MRDSVFEDLLATKEGRTSYAEEDVKFRVGELVAGLMETHNVSQVELARRMGTTKGNVHQILAGRNITLGTLGRVLHALGHRIVLYSRPEDGDLREPEFGGNDNG